MSGRWDDDTLVFCPNCGWEGGAQECHHGYIKGLKDVEPWDFCPECYYPYLEQSDNDECMTEHDRDTAEHLSACVETR